jgi:hypothetical protein
MARSLLDGTLDVLQRHVLGFGGIDRDAQSRVAVGITAALLGGDRDLADHPGEDGAALGVGNRLLPLDLLPFTMTSH